MVKFIAKKFSNQDQAQENHSNVKQNPWSKLVEEQPSQPPWKLHSAAHMLARTSEANDKTNRVYKIFILPIHGKEVATCLPILLTMQDSSP